MDERRRNKRLELNSRLIVNRLDENNGQEVTISVIDLSKTGVGFLCNEPLTIGAVYEGYLTIWTKEVIHAFLEIVRIMKTDEGFEYGAIFIGMPELDASRIDVYRMVNDK